MGFEAHFFLPFLQQGALCESSRLFLPSWEIWVTR
jgi:hypothetical protein